MTDEQMQEIQDQETLERKSKRMTQRNTEHKLPVVQAAGPVLPWPWQRRDPAHMAHTDVDILPDEHWILEVFDSLDQQSVHETLDILNRMPFQETCRQQILHVFSQSQYNAATVDIDAVERHLILQEAVALWQENSLQAPQRFCYPITLQQAYGLCQQVRVPQHSDQPQVPTMLERRRAALDRLWNEAHVPSQIRHHPDQASETTWIWPPWPTRLLVRKPVYLYVFSGRRRECDYQFYVEHFVSVYGEDGQVLLVDLALSHLHDVTDRQMLTMFLEWFRSGFVAPLLVAPPCETWSQARHNRIEGQSSPRPLRSAEFPFGLDGLTSEELDQVFVSSLLLLSSICCCSFVSSSSCPSSSGYVGASTCSQQNQPSFDMVSSLDQANHPTSSSAIGRYQPGGVWC